MRRFVAGPADPGPGEVRILVPTATLRQHLRNELARSRGVARPGDVDTLIHFAQSLVPDVREVEGALFRLMVEDAVRRLRLPQFDLVADLPGFHASLADTLAELDAAGRVAADLKRVRIAGNPLRDAVEAVWEDVEKQLAARGLATRSRILRLATRGAHNISESLRFDGFVRMSDPELALLDALPPGIDVTITLCGDDLREQLLRRGFVEEFPAKQAAPEEVVVRAETAEREVEEVVRRIARLAAEGAPLRQIGIALRSPDTYLPLFRTALARFGVPARFYFASRLHEHPVVRFLSGAVDCALTGWEHAAALEVLRMGPRASELDRLEIELIKHLPGEGLAALREWAKKSRPLARALDAFEELTLWTGFELRASDWAGRLSTLTRAFWPGVVDDGVDREREALARSQAEALKSWAKTAELAATWFAPDAAIQLNAFWEVMKKLLRLESLDTRDGARNVIHVMSALEARQWDLSALFVVGLIEKQFPRQHGRNPFFSEDALATLGVPRASEKDDAERALFDMLRSRARDLTVLSYPRAQASGQSLLPSIFIEGLPAEIAASNVQPALPAPVAPSVSRSGLHSPEMLEAAAARHQKVSVTALEKLLQCPFLFFSDRTLGIREWPDAPEKRFSPLVQGNVAHGVLKESDLNTETLGRVFGEVYLRMREEKRFLEGYRAERLRRLIKISLERYLDGEDRLGGETVEREWPFELPLDEGLIVTGKADRMDRLPDGRGVVVDYKYSLADRVKGIVKDPLALQGPLYSMAMQKLYGLEPAAMLYVNMRGEDNEPKGWGRDVPIKLNPLTDEWIEGAVQLVQDAMARVRQGITAAHPQDTEKCRWCRSRDACRVKEPAVAQAAGGQGA